MIFGNSDIQQKAKEIIDDLVSDNGPRFREGNLVVFINIPQ